MPCPRSLLLRGAQSLLSYPLNNLLFLWVKNQEMNIELFDELLTKCFAYYPMKCCHRYRQIQLFSDFRNFKHRSIQVVFANGSSKRFYLGSNFKAFDFNQHYEIFSFLLYA